MSDNNVHEDIISNDNPITEENASFNVEIGEELHGTETNVPERYRGKSLEDIIQMHSNAEKELSRQGNELGEHRKLVDKLLQAEKFNPQPAEEVLDWDYSPEEATKKLLSKEVGAIKTEFDQFKQQTAVEKFKSKYPNFDSETNSPEFLEWVKASQYRTNLYARNYNGIDLDAASELMQGWGDRTPATPVDDSKRQKDLKAAAMEKGASSGGSRKRTWSRTYIRDLRIKDPQKYKAHYDEIMQAYSDGRVTK